MILYNKYKTQNYLCLEDVLDFDISIKMNSFRVNSYFNHVKRLIRSLILLHFYIYTVYPFCPILFRTSARYLLRFDSMVLVLASSDCYDSYYKFD